MLIDFNIPPYAIVLFSIALIALLYIVVIYAGRLRRVYSKRVQCDGVTDDIVIGLPKASVVVYAHDDAEILEHTLPALLNQSYLGNFEVIVVNDGGSDETNELVTRLKNDHSNLYLTFTPEDSRNVSRKKLAITLGNKAAKGEIVVVTDATTMVGSDRWLSRMVSPFVDSDAEVVIGYSLPLLTEKRWMGRYTRWFDVAADDICWLSQAIGGKPYRASGNNIAYKRELFFRNKGFSSSLNLSHGDDDLFISEIARKNNTRVQLAYDAITQWGKDYEMPKRMRRYLLSHMFTGRQVSKTTRRIMAFGEWMIWIVIAAALAGAYMCGVTNVVGWSAAAIIIIAMLLTLSLSWRRTLGILGGPKLCLTVPFLAATRPLRNIIRDLRAGSTKNANFSWQTPR